ncbi:MAG: MFS transporter [Sphingosinicella sp.]|nr:MFS transporter [Sphingosinicella sp.]
MRDDPAATLDPALRRVLLLLGLATTIIVATEFIVTGLLPVLAADLGISLPKAGHLAGIFALSAAIFGLPLTLVAPRFAPSHLLAGILLLFAAGNVLAVLSPTYPIFLAVRALQGAALPAFISVGTAAAISLSPVNRRGKILALANVGFILGLIVAMPAGVALAEGGEWSTSFIALAVLSIAAAIVMAWAFPDTTRSEPLSLPDQAALLLRLPFLGHLLLSIAAFAAMFASYTYLAAWLEGPAGFGTAEIALTLTFFGAVGLIGNMIVAAYADRAPITCTLSSLGVASAAAVGASVTIGQIFPFLLMLGIWGAAHTAVVTACQVRVTLAGGEAPAFAIAMNIASANLGIALGAVVGGFVVDFWGLEAIGWGAAGLALVAVTLAVSTRLLAKPALAKAAGQVTGRPSQ